MVRKKTHAEFLKQVTDIHGTEYTVLEQYINATTPINIRHDICGNINPTIPHNFINKRNRCGECYGSKRKSTEQFKKEVFDLVESEYTVLGEYKNNSTEIKIKHNECNRIYGVTPTDFFRGRRCSSCGGSIGERTIEKYLKKNSIDYLKEYIIKDCYHIHPLPFDFAIFKGELLIALIEYDGEQHFIAKDKFGGEEGLSKRRIRDGIKNDFCKSYKIPLIRISYQEFKYKSENIHEILNEKLLPFMK